MVSDDKKNEPLAPAYPYGIADASVYLGVSVRTLYELVERKKIDCLRGGRIRFSKAGLDAYLETRHQRVDPPTRRSSSPETSSTIESSMPAKRRFS